MSFGGSQDYAPAKSRKPAGVDESRFSTNETAKPIPYFAGLHRQAVTFISKVFDEEHKTQESGGKAGNSRSGTKYYGSFAALIGYGRISRIVSIRLNDEIVWADFPPGAGSFNGADSITLTITPPFSSKNWGTVTIYAGTETQPVDSYLNLNNRDDISVTPAVRLDHPAYRGLAYAVFKRLYFGFNQTDVQNIEFVVVREPAISWAANEIFGNATTPVIVAAELLQHPRIGLGLPDSMLDTTALAATHQALVDEGAGSGVYPFCDRQQECRSLITEALQYAGGFPLITPEGKFNIGLYRPPASLGSLPEVNEADMVTRPDRTAGDWLEGKSETVLRHLDLYKDFKESAATWRDRGLVQITGEPSAQSIERNWLLTIDQGNQHVAALGRSAALPQSEGRVTLRKTGTLFDDLAPGALFKLNYPSRGVTGQVCRVSVRSEADAGKPQFTIDYKVDLSWLLSDAVQPEVAAAESPAPDEPLAATPIAKSLVLELPLPLCPDGKHTVAVLAARPEQLTSGFSVHLKENYDWDGAPPASYNLLAASTNFARHGTLYEPYVAETDLIDQTVGLLVQLDGPDSTIAEMSAFDAVSNELLVFVNGEILSVARAELVATGLYRLFGIRARLGTERAAHATGDEVFIIERANLLTLQHPQFDLHNEFALKLASVAGGQTLDLSEADELPGSIDGRIYSEPAPTNLRVFGEPPGSDPFTPTDGVWRHDQDIEIHWTLADLHADFYQDGKRSRVTVIEILDVFDAVVLTVESDTDEHTITNADILAALSGETDFTLRIKFRTTTEWGYVDTAAITYAMTFV